MTSQDPNTTSIAQWEEMLEHLLRGGDHRLVEAHGGISAYLDTLVERQQDPAAAHGNLGEALRNKAQEWRPSPYPAGYVWRLLRLLRNYAPVGGWSRVVKLLRQHRTGLGHVWDDEELEAYDIATEALLVLDAYFPGPEPVPEGDPYGRALSTYESVLQDLLHDPRLGHLAAQRLVVFGAVDDAVGGLAAALCDAPQRLESFVCEALSEPGVSSIEEKLEFLILLTLRINDARNDREAFPILARALREMNVQGLSPQQALFVRFRIASGAEVRIQLKDTDFEQILDLFFNPKYDLVPGPEHYLHDAIGDRP